MAHGLAAQLGGAFTIESVLGEGTSIELWLPISATHVPDAEFEAAHVVFTYKELADLTIAVGVINAYNRIAISFHREPRRRLARPTSDASGTAAASYR